MVDKEQSPDEKLADNLWNEVNGKSIEGTKHWLQQRADPNHPMYWRKEWTKGHPRSPPLHTACSKNLLEIAKILIDAGANVEKGDLDFDRKPLHVACENGHIDIVKFLVEQIKCNIDVLDKKKKTPLHLACEKAHVIIVECLVDKSNIDLMDERERTPLDMTKFLLKFEDFKNNTNYMKIVEILQKESTDRLDLYRQIEQLLTALYPLIEAEAQRQYINKLIIDKKKLRYLKLFLVGPPNVGKTTFLKKLMISIQNNTEEPKTTCALLASCISGFAIVSDCGKYWTYSSNLDQEAMLLFRYVCGHNLESIHVQAPGSPQPTLSSSTPVASLENENQSIMERVRNFTSRLKDVHNNSTYSNLMDRLGTTLLSVNDIGGHPGFIEMLPALSPGPSIYFLFINLVKDEYETTFQQEESAYSAKYTNKSIITQILSAIACMDSQTTQTNELAHFPHVKPVATLIGTHADELKDRKTKTITSWNKEFKEFNKITANYPNIYINPGSFQRMFAVGKDIKDDDIVSLRKFLYNKVIKIHYKKAFCEIPQRWLWLSLILRREYKIVPKDICIQFAQYLEMNEMDTEVSLQYLHHYIGTILYFRDTVLDIDNSETLPDEWFKNNILCSLQVIFDSINELIIVPLRKIISGDGVMEKHKTDFLKKGQFSIESIETYCSDKTDEEVEAKKLIPRTNLINLLCHAQLLAPITYSKTRMHSNQRMFLMPAMLECGTELSPPPLPDTNSRPESLCLTFHIPYVPTGLFCKLITHIIMYGPNEILGLIWELIEEGVKKNCVEFRVAKSNCVTLISTESYIEIRVTKHHPEMSLHNFCSCVLSVICYTICTLSSYKVYINFKCICLKHKKAKTDNLCKLTDDGKYVQFLCDESKEPVHLSSGHHVWFRECEVCSGDDVELTVLNYTNIENFSLLWTKVGSRSLGNNCEIVNVNSILKIKKVRNDNSGYYQCTVKKAEKEVFTIYKAVHIGSVGPRKRLPDETHISSDAKKPQGSTPVSSINEGDTNDTANKGKSSLEYYKSATGVCDVLLDLEIEEKHFFALGSHFDNLGGLLEKLPLTPANRADVIQTKDKNGVQNAVASALYLWRKIDPIQVTYRNLVLILDEVGKRDTAIRVCKCIVEQ